MGLGWLRARWRVIDVTPLRGWGFGDTVIGYGPFAPTELGIEILVRASRLGYPLVSFHVAKYFSLTCAAHVQKLMPRKNTLSEYYIGIDFENAPMQSSNQYQC